MNAYTISGLVLRGRRESTALMNIGHLVVIEAPFTTRFIDFDTVTATAANGVTTIVPDPRVAAVTCAVVVS